MTVARLQAEMSADEFMRWTVFYGRERQRAQLVSGKGRLTAKGK